MRIVERNSKLWKYLNDEIRDLIIVGEHLFIECHALADEVEDYSYLVFPFAKGYEGFLKHFFLDLGLIKEEEFYGEIIRIGRVLNPIFKDKDYSVYAKLAKHKEAGEEVSARLWNSWKRGRNQVFHYFPHNFRRLSSEEAHSIIIEMVSAMEDAVEILNKT